MHTDQGVLDSYEGLLADFGILRKSEWAFRFDIARWSGFGYTSDIHVAVVQLFQYPLEDVPLVLAVGFPFPWCFREGLLLVPHTATGLFVALLQMRLDRMV